MMNPMITSKLAEAHRHELLEEAEQQRLVRESAAEKPHIIDQLLVAMERLRAFAGRQATTRSQHLYAPESTIHAKDQDSEVAVEAKRG